jgi:hypothetical protein
MSDDASRAQGNRRIAIGLALFAVAVFLSVIFRQWTAGT